MMVLFSLLISAIPILFFFVLIKIWHRLDELPLKIPLIHLIWGASGAIFLSIIISFFISNFLKLSFFELNSSSYFMTVTGAPLVEEISKGTYLFRTSKNSNSLNISAGLILGGAIGLGFALTENLMYFLNSGFEYSSSINELFMRTIFTSSMHFAATAVFGAFVALNKLSISKYRGYFLLTGIALAFFIHFLWNAIFTFTPEYFKIFIFVSAVIVLIVFLMKYFLSIERKIILYELKNEKIDSNIWAKIHSALKNGEVNSEIEEFIPSLIKLGIKKRLLVKASKKDRPIILNEIFKIRFKLIEHKIIISGEANGG